MTARRRAIALSAAVAGSLLAPLAAAPPAQATHCPPDSLLTTDAPFYLPGVGPTQGWTPFYATAPLTFAVCARGMVRGDCTDVEVDDGSTVTVVPAVHMGQSCVNGATRFYTGAWAP